MHIEILDTDKTMKKVLKTLVIAALAVPTFAFADKAKTTSVSKVQAAIGPTTTQAQFNNGQATVVSPRTGIQYTFPNPKQRPVIIRTEAIAPATSSTADRIVASNPALSSESQQIAKKALIAAQ